MCHAVPVLGVVPEVLWKTEEGGKDAKRSVVIMTVCIHCNRPTVSPWVPELRFQYMGKVVKYSYSHQRLQVLTDLHRECVPVRSDYWEGYSERHGKQ